MYDIIRRNPETAPILKELIDYERNNLDPKWGEIYNKPGIDAAWAWTDVSIVTSKCRKLVDLGFAKVIFKSNSSTVYCLTDREEISKALELYESEEQDRLDMKGVVRPLQLPDDIFSLIVGFDDIKDAIHKTLKSSKPVHILLWGPPATAKSSFLEEIAGLPDALFILGSSSSKVGLTEELFDKRPRILIIDEIDKMDREDQSALLSLCHTGYISETKHGKKREDQLDTIVFAACNNISFLTKEMQSRFMKFKLKEYTNEELKDVVTLTLTQREHIEETLAEYIASSGILGGLRDVRDFVRIGRLCSNTEEVTRMIATMGNYSGG